MKKFVEERFWMVFVIALLLGLFFPLNSQMLSSSVIPLMAIVLFLTYVKIDYFDVLAHIKQPFFVGYVLFVYLLFIPAILFGIFQFVYPEFAIAVLLLCAMPPGVAAPFFTDIMKGNTSLSTAVTLLSYVAAPFTIVGLLFFLAQKTINLDLWALAQTLFLVNFLPLVLSQIVRKVKKQLITQTQAYFTTINILIVSFILYIIIANYAKDILSQPLSSLVTDILWMYVLFVVQLLAGYFFAFWRSKTDKVALAVSKTYMNNALAIGLAFAFFDPRITIVMVLSEIPWNTTLGPFTYLLRHIK